VWCFYYAPKIVDPLVFYFELERWIFLFFLFNLVIILFFFFFIIVSLFVQTEGQIPSYLLTKNNIEKNRIKMKTTKELYGHFKID
jgi:hypothetical protein